MKGLRHKTCHREEVEEEEKEKSKLKKIAFKV
jgi:hypothetical protein